MNCACGNPHRAGWTHRQGWCNEGDDHWPARPQPPGLRAVAENVLAKLHEFDAGAERHAMVWQRPLIAQLETALGVDQVGEQKDTRASE